MRTGIKAVGSSALISLLLILPLVIMEVVNRREFNEEFPYFLFLIMGFNLFAFILILLPLVPGRRAASQAVQPPAPPQNETLLTRPVSAAVIGVILFLFPGIIAWLDSLGWEPVRYLFNGPDPEQAYLPGMFFSLLFLSFPAAGGVIARGPVLRTLRVGGRLLAHPLNLIIAVFIASAFGIGLANLVVDQWPCFIGVPMCD
jgi:hypothetical protein